jgi:hypothetical protein
MAEAERLRQILLADAGRGDLLKTIIGRLQGCVFTREFPLRIKPAGPLPHRGTVPAIGQLS